VGQGGRAAGARSPAASRRDPERGLARGDAVILTENDTNDSTVTV
jgi:hypothetical protein